MHAQYGVKAFQAISFTVTVIFAYQTSGN